MRAAGRAGNIELTHSISAGLDYAAVGPEHAWLQQQGRTEYAYASDAEALEAFQTLARLEGILPALESAHGVAHAMRVAARPGARGHRPGESVGARRQGPADGREALRAEGHRTMDESLHDTDYRDLRAAEGGRARPGLVTYITAGDPSLARTRDLLFALARAGADVIELGVPFSDPLADGPVIQRATERALAAGTTLDARAGPGGRRARELATPIVLFTYANPIARMGFAVFAERAAAAGVDGVLLLDVPMEEAGEVQGLLDARGIDTIFLLSPTTTPERIREAARAGPRVPVRHLAARRHRCARQGRRGRRRAGRPHQQRDACRWRSASASRIPITCAKSAGGRMRPWSAAVW